MVRKLSIYLVMFSGMLIRDGFEWATENFNVAPRRELLILYVLRCCCQINHALGASNMRHSLFALSSFLAFTTARYAYLGSESVT